MDKQDKYNPIKIQEVDDSVKPIPEFEGRQIYHAPAEAVTAPSGGATVDTQARTAINDIISRLQLLGLLK